MKLLQITAIVFGISCLCSCEKDNIKEPTSKLAGKVTAQGQPISVRSSGVQFEIWQRGFQLFSKVALNIGQDGNFSAVLPDGDYLVVRTPGAGPWVDNTDTVRVSLRGTANVDIPVDPFFNIRTANFERNGNAVRATFIIDRGAGTRTLELARLYLGPNLITDQNNNSGTVQVAASGITFGNTVTLNLTIPAAIANDDFIFARLGVKTVGVAELLYTQPQKIQLK